MLYSISKPEKKVSTLEICVLIEIDAQFYKIPTHPWQSNK